MRELVDRLGFLRDVVVQAYARAEEAGLVLRRRNSHRRTAMQYASALFADGVRKRWLK